MDSMNSGRQEIEPLMGSSSNEVKQRIQKPFLSIFFSANI